MEGGLRQYRVVETLGSGSFGTVYRAEFLGVGGFTKQVALKVLNLDRDSTGEVAQRLRDEARVLGLIQHRTIVGIHSLAHLDRGWAVVMDLVGGVDASELVALGPTPVAPALGVVGAVAEGLDAAWNARHPTTGRRLRLVHRDIKPENIRLTAHGDVKLLDFGIARADFLGREAETRSMAWGSPLYMAPERIDGEEGPEIDIYSLGLVLVELLTGRTVPKRSLRERRHLEQVQALLREVALHVGAPDRTSPPRGVDGVLAMVEEMLAYDPRERPSADDLARRCRELIRRVPQPWLQEWAEQVVPQLSEQTDQREPRPGDLAPGTLLIERGPATSAPTSPPAASPSPSPAPSPAPAPLPARDPVPPPAASPRPTPNTRAPLGSAAPPAPSPAPSERDRRVLVALLTTAALLILGLTAWLLIPGEPEPEPEPLSLPKPEVPEAPEPEPEPVPVPVPVPVKRKPTAPKAPEPEPTPAPVAATGTLVVTGDAASVAFLADTRRYGPGTVPEGTYAIEADFGASGVRRAGSVTVVAGQTRTVQCVQAFLECRTR